MLRRRRGKHLPTRKMRRWWGRSICRYEDDRISVLSTKNSSDIQEEIESKVQLGASYHHRGRMMRSNDSSKAGGDLLPYMVAELTSFE